MSRSYVNMYVDGISPIDDDFLQCGDDAESCIVDGKCLHARARAIERERIPQVIGICTPGVAYSFGPKSGILQCGHTKGEEMKLAIGCCGRLCM